MVRRFRAQGRNITRGTDWDWRCVCRDEDSHVRAGHYRNHRVLATAYSCPVANAGGGNSYAGILCRDGAGAHPHCWHSNRGSTGAQQDSLGHGGPDAIREQYAVGPDTGHLSRWTLARDTAELTADVTKARYRLQQYVPQRHHEYAATQERCAPLPESDEGWNDRKHERDERLCAVKACLNGETKRSVHRECDSANHH